MAGVKLEHIKPMRAPYFYGRISRDDAEQILKDRGCAEGLYLLRESMSQAGNYALSICHNNNVHHYSIEQQPDGKVMIQDGKRFPGPVELIRHHEKVLDGFLTRPTLPCERNANQPAMAWPGITMMELEQSLLEEASMMNLQGSQLENALGPQRQRLIQKVARNIHKTQPFFHGVITREEADKRMSADRHHDGKYLVREREDKTFALSLSYKNQTKHYKIEIHKDIDKLAIEDGPRFESIIEMIGHYHNKTDGLLCKLTSPCVRKGYKKPKVMTQTPLDKNMVYGVSPATTGQAENNLSYNDQNLPPRTLLNRPVLPSTTPPRPTPPLPSRKFEQKLNDPRIQEVGIIGNEHVQNSVWDDPDIPEDPAALAPKSRTGMDDDNQKIYDSVPRTEEVFNLNKNDLELVDKLGAGNFGAVMRGFFKRNSYQIPVAIKTLKHDDLHNAESDMMKEAKVMAGLQHRNIVRLIGVCKCDTIMLVMELAPLGPLNKYLKKHPDLPLPKVICIMFQVAEGMEYLENKNFVHRDLAARNVLLANEEFAKISDFGMSKALGIGNNYYQAETAGKWPLKWYAPECIYYFKFDSKSDVWSFGVTLWEALSYGAKPYKGKKGQEILHLIENGGRLETPSGCPPGVYDIMLRCWSYDRQDRPSFKDIIETLRKFK